MERVLYPLPIYEQGPVRLAHVLLSVAVCMWEIEAGAVTQEGDDAQRDSVDGGLQYVQSWSRIDCRMGSRNGQIH